MPEEDVGPRKISPQLGLYLIFARAMFFPASGLAAIGILSCLVFGGLGEFWCTLPRDSIIANGSRDFFGIAVVTALPLAIIRGLGGNTPEMLDKLAIAFDDYSFPGVYVFSTLISWAQFICMTMLLVAFVSLFVPLGIVIYEFRTVWSTCVMGASGHV